MEQWEMETRECVRDTLARYNWSGDALRLEQLAATFCEDGELAIRGRDPVQGRAAIVRLLGGDAPDDEARRRAAKATSAAVGQRRIVRHNVSNIRFVAVRPHEAQVDSYFTVLTEIGLDHYGRYRDTFVPVGDEWLIKQRQVSTDWHAVDSTVRQLPG